MEYNLENSIITLFDFYYNKNNIEDYQIGTLNPKEIKIENLKFMDEKIKENLWKQIVKGKFRMEGFHNNTIYLKRFSDSFPTLLKISFYKNQKEINDLNYSSNRDSFFSYLFSEKVLKNEINNVELPIFNLDMKYEDIKTIIDTYPENNKIEEDINQEKIINTMSLRMRDRFCNSKRLSIFLTENKINFSELIFELLITLGQIYHFYPNFRYHNLDLDSIEIEEKNEKKIVEYLVNNQNYSFETKIKIKLGSFEDASLEPIIKNTHDKFDKNHFADLFYFCYQLKNHQFYKNVIFDELGKEIFNEIMPEKISIKNNKGKIMENIQPITPEKILIKHFKSSRTIKDKKIEQNGGADKIMKGLRNLKPLKIKGKLPSALGNQDVLTEEPKLKRVEKKIVNKVNDKRNLQMGGALVRPNMPITPGAHMTNDQRLSYRKLQADRPDQNVNPNLIAEQRVYQPPKPKTQAQTQPALYPPAFVPVNTPYSSVPIPLPYMYKPNQLPIQNIYNLNIADPRGDHSILARVYEDMVPGKEFGLSSTTVLERIKSSEYIKSIMLKSKDGEDMSLTGGANSLLEHVQLHNLNPYHYENPQNELPNDMLLYSSAYPIRYNADKQQIQLSKDSVGLNIRIFRLSSEELKSHFNSDTSRFSHKVWRELEYYKKVNEIIKTQKIPNLVKMHFWVLDKESRIKWNQLKDIKYSGTTLKAIQQAIAGKAKVVAVDEKKQKILVDFQKHIVDSGLQTLIEAEINKGLNDQTWINLESTYGTTYSQLKDLTKPTNIVRKTIEALAQKTAEDILADSTVSLGIITESPQHTFVNWATPIYQGSGSLKTMTQTGYHEPEVWISLLFQYIYGLSILQKNKIYLDNFDPLYNLLVKDIFTDDRETKHWRYQVDDLTYYIPNYGYVGMIDSYYNDIKMEGIPKEDGTDLSSSDLTQIENDIFEKMFKPLLDTNFYNILIKQKYGALQAPPEFMKIITELNNETTKGSKQIKHYLSVFTMFLHNRAGTPLSNTEIETVDLTRVPTNLRKDQLLVRRDPIDNRYKFVINLERDNDPSLPIYITKYKIWTGSILESVSSAQLYVTNDVIEPELKKGVRYDIEALLEKYRI
jgi:hypothetical protein